MKKSFSDKLASILSLIAILIGIVAFFKEDASARARNENDIEQLKKAAPGIESRLDAIERQQAAFGEILIRIEKKIDKL